MRYPFFPGAAQQSQGIAKYLIIQDHGNNPPALIDYQVRQRSSQTSQYNCIQYARSVESLSVIHSPPLLRTPFLRKDNLKDNRHSCILLKTMRFIVFISLLSVGTIAIPTSKPSDILPADGKSLSHSSKPIMPIDGPSMRRYLHPVVKTMHDESYPYRSFRGADDYEKLVAFCEAGFTSGCRAAIEQVG